MTRQQTDTAADRALPAGAARTAPLRAERRS